MEGNIFLNTIKLITVDLLGDVLYFPIWWFTLGLKKSALFFWSQFLGLEAGLGFRIWFLNLFQPMFGQRDIAGKLISFVIRLVQIFVRGLLLILGFVVILAAFIVWVWSPVIILAMLAYNFNLLNV